MVKLVQKNVIKQEYRVKNPILVEFGQKRNKRTKKEGFL
jgi:hypothetical protein